MSPLSSMPARASNQGFSLVEVVIALGVLTFVVVGIMGLFVVAMQTSAKSSEVTTAANIATLLINQRRLTPIDPTGATPAELADFGLPDFSLSRTNYNSATGAITTPMYVGQDGHRASTMAEASYGVLYSIVKNARSASIHLTLYWPPQAPAPTAQGRYEVVTEASLP